MIAPLRTQNVFLIVTDGLRWQEVFRGAEERPDEQDQRRSQASAALQTNYWRATPEARRAALLPFLWGEIAPVHGQLFGNQDKGSVVRR